MATLRQLVSSIRGLNKLFSADNKITNRVIAGEIRSAAIMLIKQETNKRRLWQSPNLFTEIRCIEMIEVPLAECCTYTSPCMIRRSREKLPKVAEGIFNLLIQGVYNVSGTDTYQYASPNRYANLLKMKLRSKQKFYWFRNDYLYVTDIDVEIVSMLAFFEEPVPQSFFSCDTKVTCSSPLDDEFKMPGYLEKGMKDIVNDTLMKTYFSHLQDYTADGKDDSR